MHLDLQGAVLGLGDFRDGSRRLIIDRIAVGQGDFIERSELGFACIRIFPGFRYVAAQDRELADVSEANLGEFLYDPVCCNTGTLRARFLTFRNRSLDLNIPQQPLTLRVSRLLAVPGAYRGLGSIEIDEVFFSEPFLLVGQCHGFHE